METDVLPWNLPIYVQRDVFLTRTPEPEIDNETVYVLYSATLTNHVDSNSAAAESPSAVNSEGDLCK